MLWLAVDICRKPGNMAPAKRMFGYSILYLFVLFACLLGETLVVRLMA
jgi:protoheme IX farnesyltransferase